LEDLLIEYEDIFDVDSEDYGRTNKGYHRLDTEDVESTAPERKERLYSLKEGAMWHICSMQKVLSHKNNRY
jgi:hypothetical protein